MPSAYAGCVRPRTPADARVDARMHAARLSVLWAESWHAATRKNGAAAATAHHQHRSCARGRAWHRALAGNGVAISMDGKGAWRDNVFVERLWRSVKYAEVYLRAYDSVSEARASI